jgi:hypothetical protein
VHRCSSLDINLLAVLEPNITSSDAFGCAVYVFVRDGAVWTQQAYLKANNPGQDDQFGYAAVSISGDTIVVGAHNEDSNATGVIGLRTMIQISILIQEQHMYL